MVRISDSHSGGRGSIPRGGMSFYHFDWSKFLFTKILGISTVAAATNNALGRSDVIGEVIELFCFLEVRRSS